MNIHRTKVLGIVLNNSFCKLHFYNSSWWQVTVFERVSDSIQAINSTMLIHSWNKQWTMSHWLIQATDSFKNSLIQSGTKHLLCVSVALLKLCALTNWVKRVICLWIRLHCSLVKAQEFNTSHLLPLFHNTLPFYCIILNTDF